MKVAMPGIAAHNTMIFWMVLFSAAGPYFALLSSSAGFFAMERVRRTEDTVTTPKKIHACQ